MYEPVENLRHQYELCDKVKKLRISFKEYALLFRLQEGAKPDHIFESLYLSSATFYRCRQKIIKKFKARSFEEALIKAGKELF